MKIQYSPEFYRLYKKHNVRIRNAFDRSIAQFKRNPFDPELNNHDLHREYSGYRSIDIANEKQNVVFY